MRLGQYAHAGAVEVEQLDSIVPSVAENEERAAFGIFAQPLLRGHPQAVEVGAQITRGRGHEHFEVSVKTQHEIGALRAWSSWAARAIWLASARRIRTELPHSTTKPERVVGDGSSTCTKSGDALTADRR